MTVRGYVYFVADDAAQAVKIGWSENPRDRFATLQVGSFAPLRLVGYLPDDDGETEARLHDLLALFRLRGEWFDLGVPALAPYLRVAAEYAALDHNRAQRRNQPLPPLPPEIVEIAKSGWM